MRVESIALLLFSSTVVASTRRIRLSGREVMGEDGSPSPEELAAKFDTTDVRERRLAMEALVRVGYAAWPAAATITTGLADSDPKVRQFAKDALHNIGRERSDRNVLRDMAKKLNAKRFDCETRRIVISALQYIGHTAHIVAKEIVIALIDPDLVVRDVAKQTWLDIDGPTPAAAVRIVAREVIPDVDDVRHRLIGFEALTTLGAKAAPAVHEITLGLADEDEECRRVATELFQVIGEADRLAINRLARNLEPDIKLATRRLNYGALQILGAHASPALRQLTLGLADPDPLCRRAASETLEVIQAYDPAAIRELTDGLTTTNTVEKRRRSIDALALLNDRALHTILDDVVAVSNDKDAEVAEKAAKLVERCRSVLGDGENATTTTSPT